MGFIIRLLLTAVAVYLSAYLTPGVDVKNFWSAIVVAIVLILLNIFIKPILQFISIPVTILTLGLFLFVINAAVILLASYLVGSFQVAGFWSAMLYSIIFSIISWILEAVFG